MNNTPNYPYLAGILQSELEYLAYDNQFFKLKKIEERLAYLKKIAESAHIKAVQFDADFNARMAKV